MNLMLSLILLTVSGIAYFAFTVQQQTNDTFQQRIDAWQQQVNQLQDTIAQEKVKEANWNAQLDKASREASQNAAATPAPAASVLSSETNPAAQAPTSSSSDLGTITTIEGKTFQGCKLLKVEPDGITFSHADGITKVLFPFLSPEMRKRFGYDPEKTVEMEAAEARYRAQAAAAAGTNGAQTTTQ